MTALLLNCAICGKATDTEKSRDAVCRDCIVTKTTTDESKRYVALMTKRMRYEVAGKLRAHNDEPLKVAERRLITKIRMYAPWTKHEDLVKFLTDCRQEAESRVVAGVDGGRSKHTILIARKGDLTLEASKSGQLAGKSTLIPAHGILTGRANVGADLGVGEHMRITKEQQVLRRNT